MTGSTFLNQIGLGGFDLGYLLIGMTVTILLLLIFLILLIVQIRKTSKLKKRLDKFLTGKNGTSLEQDIAGLYEDNKFLKANTEKNKKDIRTLYKNMESAYQKMHCWMKIIMDLLLIPFIVLRVVILTLRRSNSDSVRSIWELRRQKHFP